MTILAQTGVWSWALQSTKYGTGTLSAAKAVAQLIYSGQPADADTLIIGSKTYTWKTTLTPAVNEIKIGATLAISLANAVAAITAGAGSGTAYGAGTTANAQATAVLAYDTIFLTAISAGGAGNAYALSSTTSGSNLTIVSFAGGITAGSYDLTTLNWEKHRASDIDYDVVQDSRIFPLEVGSVITPTGAYKAGAYAAGGATIFPRLQDKFGELLLGSMGKDTVIANSPVASAYTHVFSFDPNNIAEIPWFAARKMVPGRGVVRPQGVIGMDNKIMSLRIAIPQNDIVSARVDMVGRVPSFDNYADAWLYAADYENSDKAPISCKGDFQIPTVFNAQLPVTSVVVELVNNLTTPRQEMVVGAYNPDDFAVISRIMTVRCVLKWNDPELYQRIHSNAAGGTAWSPTPFITTYSAGNYGFQADVQAVSNIPATSQPYTLTIRAAVVVWESDGPIQLRGGSIVSMPFRGTVLQPDASLGVNYADIILVNGRSSAYTVPAAP